MMICPGKTVILALNMANRKERASKLHQSDLAYF